MNELDILEKRYRCIWGTTLSSPDFTAHGLQTSRDLFSIKGDVVVPKRFNVVTITAGLPVDDVVKEAAATLMGQVRDALPETCRVYRVKPGNLQWEALTVKWPSETLSRWDLEALPNLVKAATRKVREIPVNYRGGLLTHEGTILLKGYGEFATMRSTLTSHVPFASPRRSDLGHISIGRILDPVGPETFHALSDLIDKAWDEHYCQVFIRQLKLVHETQWYMESRQIVETYDLLP